MDDAYKIANFDKVNEKRKMLETENFELAQKIKKLNKDHEKEVMELKSIRELQQENKKCKEVIGNIYSLLNDYEMQNDDVISSYCGEIRNVMKGVE